MKQICPMCGITYDRRKDAKTCGSVCASRVRIASIIARRLCRKCQKVPPAASRGYCLDCRRKARIREKRIHYELRLEVLAAYGNKCACCGESRYEFLSIDHIFNDGAEHKRALAVDKKGNRLSSRALYTWLQKHGYPKDRFQVLCFNCNCAKGFFGYCPHVGAKAATML